MQNKIFEFLIDDLSYTLICTQQIGIFSVHILYACITYSIFLQLVRGSLIHLDNSGLGRFLDINDNDNVSGTYLDVIGLLISVTILSLCVSVCERDTVRCLISNRTSKTVEVWFKSTTTSTKNIKTSTDSIVYSP